MWICKCDCGKEIIASGSNLSRNHTNSCGCYQIQQTSNANKTHGLSKTDLYGEWNEINMRCYNPNVKAYKYYGARGITNYWKNDPIGFIDWSMKNGYRKGLTLDRIDVNLGYSPDNCRWTTWDVQGINKRNIHKIEYEGKLYSRRSFCMTFDLIESRVKKCMSMGMNASEIIIKSKRGE